MPRIGPEDGATAVVGVMYADDVGAVATVEGEAAAPAEAVGVDAVTGAEACR